ncbi:unnamed protein product, partial [Hermetia illucens]
MDTVQTAVSKEDALQKDIGESNACEDGPLKSEVTTCAGGDSDLKPASDKGVVGSEKVAGLHIAAPSESENSDDLLEKIEAVVKDEKNGDVPVDATIAESSEQDFLKQLEEAEAEAKALREERRERAKEEQKAKLMESVSSSDEKEKAGNEVILKDTTDEPDRVHVAENNADSTSADVGNNAKETAQKGRRVGKSDEVATSNEAAESSAADVEESLRRMENGEVEPVEDEKSEEKDEVREEPKSTNNSSVLVSSSDGKEDAVPAKVVVNESQDAKNSSEADQAPISEEPTVSDEATQEEEISSEAEKAVSEEDKKVEDTKNEAENLANPGDNKTSEAQPMSVDQSPVGGAETMEVDEEEKMEVDPVEVISDEEMPPAVETESIPDAKDTPAEEVPSESTSKAVVAADTENVEPESKVEEAEVSKGPEPPSKDSEKTKEAATSPDEDNETSEKEAGEVETTVVSASSKDQADEAPVKEKSTTASEPSKTSEAVVEADVEKKEKEETACKEQVLAPKSPDSSIVESVTSDKAEESAKPKEIEEKPANTSEKPTETSTDVDLESENTSKLSVAKPENKLLTNAIKLSGSVTSLEGSPVQAASANVFNSTPIQRQFDISSENVSKISEAHEETNRTAEEGAHSLSKTEEETDVTEMTSASEPQTSDSATKFLNVMKKQCNGTSSDDGDIPTTTAKASQTKPFEIIPEDLLAKATDTSPGSGLYEINVWHEGHDVRYLSVEKLDTKKSVNTTLDASSAGESSGKLSSNGSVSSLPPFTLPNRTSETLSGSSTSSKTPDGKSLFPHTTRTQHTVTGVLELCTFMIDQFTKIKSKFEPPSTPTTSKVAPTPTKDEPSTPKLKGRASTKKSKGKSSPQEEEEETPSKKQDKRTLKRSLNKTQSDDEEESKAKQSKQSKSSHAAAKSQEVTVSALYYVLAKWVDKKYYAGRVTEEKAGNKFVVLFEDGASKVLPRESIVFGEGNVLPLKDQSVYALLDDDYELGTVKSVDETDDKVIYTVDVDGKDIKVSASDIYLTDQQAKTIQHLKDAQNTPSTNKNALDSPSEKSSPGTSSRSTRKRPATSPITPEAGFSGGVTKRGGRKQKRLRPETRLSESTDVSDSPDIPPPPSPESALEAIEGVQPELQKTPKESEVSRLIITSDFARSNPGRDIGTLIGSTSKSKTLFKNKCFLLTCTVTPFKGSEPISSFKLHSSQGFSNLPFIKDHLKKQIESAGGKVYDHFEDVPKSKYKQCKLIASRPCTTAKYVQCLAADVPAVSHEWIIESCKKNTLSDVKKFQLPSGWSIVTEKYIRWTV